MRKLSSHGKGHINRFKYDRWTSRVNNCRLYDKKIRQRRPDKRWRDDLAKDSARQANLNATCCGLCPTTGQYSCPKVMMNALPTYTNISLQTKTIPILLRFIGHCNVCVCLRIWNATCCGLCPTTGQYSCPKVMMNGLPTYKNISLQTKTIPILLRFIGHCNVCVCLRIWTLNK